MTNQRSYQAACPNCGAPVEFKSAASRLAVCGFCRSTISRDGDALRRIGEMAELFEDHGVLQLGAAGKVEGATSLRLGPVGAAQPEPVGGFTIVGRLQYRYEEGVWNEWHLLFDTAATGWLSEDNGRYALTREQGMRTDLPAATAFEPGRGFRMAGQSFQIASVVQARLIAAAGELPFAPQLNQPFWLVDARAIDGRIATLDFSELDQQVRVYVGTAIELTALAMTGLKQDSGKTLAGRAFNCPSCGAGVQVKLGTSKSVTCGSCASVVDLSKQGDAGLAFTKQTERYACPIPLGSQGSIDGVDWQAVGFARRSGIADDGERFSWSEVLLYNQSAGFAFIVVASDAVSLVRPVQDVPAGVGWNSMRYRGNTYKAEPSYSAVVDYVEGEFYWQVRIGQTTRNADYGSGELVLSREESVGQQAREVVWSQGKKYHMPDLAKAFGLEQIALTPADAQPVPRLEEPSSASVGLPAGAIGSAASAAATSGSIGIWIVLLVIVVVLVLIFMMMDGSGGGSGSSYGGSRGGYAGSSHK